MGVKIGIVGLGYVGLPVALAFARKFPGTVGFDINSSKVAKLNSGVDETGEVSTSELKASTILLTDKSEDLTSCNFFVVAVPTPIDGHNRPDLTPVLSASRTVGLALRKGATVVFESTVYPGVTEEICGPILEQVSGLKQSVDFKLGYSPERINPGDKEHTIEKIIKVVSGEDESTAQLVAEVYGRIIDAGVYKAESIKVAEAAKVIENTQRDLNIALMNELALIFDRMNINTNDVLRAAGTKWNFLNFRPGLVGGHCIGVDPYYLTSKAEELGYIPEVILAGRRINDSIGRFIAQKTIKLMLRNKLELNSSRVAILGLTFKEDVPDIRNSRVPDIARELEEFNIKPSVFDPIAAKEDSFEEYGIEIGNMEDHKGEFDVCIIAVAHDRFKDVKTCQSLLKNPKKGIIIDVKSVFGKSSFPESCIYWSL